jgi:3-oxoacyl-[acyl-carrier protein] reductase
MNISLKGKNALVCGSTKGIGLAVAHQLAASGARVILLARDQDALQKTLGALPGDGHFCVQADFSHPAQLIPAAEDALSKFRHIHILINNTGGPPGGLLTEAEPDAFRQTFNQHLIANHLLMQRLLPGMKEAGYGRIINIISTSVKQPLKGLGVSNTIRAAVANWAKTLSVEVAPFGITVNNVLPGATDTDRLRGLISAKGLKSGLSEDEIRNEMLSEIPAARFAQPSEIAAAAVFLASEHAAYINGINLPVDGGRTSCL